MSDFFNSGWSIFVAAVTIVSLIACLALLIIAARRRVMANDNTTGHVWDEDLRELNNPLPRWWMWLFVITVVFAAVYLALYPGLGNAPGVLKWSSTGQWQTEQDKAHAAMAPVYAQYTAMPAAALAFQASTIISRSSAEPAASWVVTKALPLAAPSGVKPPSFHI